MKTLQVFFGFRFATNKTFTTTGLVVSCLFILLSCNPGKDRGLLMALENLDPNMSKDQFYLIIPNQGCDGCISSMEDFVLNNYSKNTNIKYVFTRVQSRKTLKVKLGKEILSNPNVIIDAKNSIVYPDKKNEIYPMIVSIIGNEVKEIYYQSPFQNGIDILTKQLNENGN